MQAAAIFLQIKAEKNCFIQTNFFIFCQNGTENKENKDNKEKSGGFFKNKEIKENKEVWAA